MSDEDEIPEEPIEEVRVYNRMGGLYEEVFGT
jgi:hypothetical protein